MKTRLKAVFAYLKRDFLAAFDTAPRVKSDIEKVHELGFQEWVHHGYLSPYPSDSQLHKAWQEGQNSADEVDRSWL